MAANLNCNRVLRIFARSLQLQDPHPSISRAGLQTRAPLWQHRKNRMALQRHHHPGKSRTKQLAFAVETFRKKAEEEKKNANFKFTSGKPLQSISAKPDQTSIPGKLESLGSPEIRPTPKSDQHTALISMPNLIGNGKNAESPPQIDGNIIKRFLT